MWQVEALHNGHVNSVINERTLPGTVRQGLTRVEPGISQYNGLAIHRRVLNRLQNFLLYSSFQRVTNQST